MTAHATARPAQPPLRDRVDLMELEIRLNDAKRAIAVASHMGLEAESLELTVYAVLQARNEVEAALKAFYNNPQG